jgi:hypothetical protein
VVDVEPDGPPRVVGVRITRSEPAELAGEPISFQDARAQSAVHVVVRPRLTLERREDVLARAEVRPIVVGKDAHALVVAELPDSPLPRTDPADRNELAVGQNLPDVFLEEHS